MRLCLSFSCFISYRLLYSPFPSAFFRPGNCPSLSFIEGIVLLTMKAAKGKGAVKKDAKESLKLVDDRKIGKRKAAVKPDKGSKRKAKKEKLAKKDPNKPKRPPSAFFVFLEEFRKTYKQDHPNVKAVSAVGKAGGEKWKSLSVAEKAPYEAKAAKKKSEYEKLMNAYNKKQESGADDGDEESDRSRSEINDEDEESGAEEEEEEEDDED
ncbi:PREDICTED: high mobility group B protein 1-like isoform X1 [Nelumbo nucifera]|uniref:High mobility group B protein 1-like isoform X1 n=2 Tax=Nelumbo nucifera TaxID=4432 RepID=A0A1U7ZKY2_NELNU|nr:PREDICTED: high mobility group B protein 1-like isoform X1 [Nelumbo nucifera]